MMSDNDFLLDLGPNTSGDEDVDYEAPRTPSYHAWKFWPKIRPTFRGRAEDWVHVNQKNKNGGSKGTWPSENY